MDPANEMPAPLSHEERVPERAPFFSIGDNNIPTASIDFDGTAPAQSLDDLVRVGSGEDYKLYAKDEDAPVHIAVFEQETATLEERPGGWEADTGDAVVSLPEDLAKEGVGFASGQGSLEISPVGAAAPATKDGTIVTYADALPGVDLRYWVTPGGYKEAAVLNEKGAGDGLSWSITSSGLTLSPEGGSIFVLRDRERIAEIPPPFVTDADGVQAEASWALEQKSENAYEVSIDWADDFLARAAYPVKIDPGVTTILYASRDTFVNEGQPNTQFENNSLLKVHGDPVKYSFIRFDTAAIQQQERLVYQADLKLYASVAPGGGANIKARQVTSSWPTGNMTWNNQPAASTSIAAETTANDDAWATLDLRGVYQGYIDTTVTDLGARIGSGSDVQFNSSDHSGSNDPQLQLWYNDLPEDPTATALTGTIETDSPTLGIDGPWPTDPNSDEVLVRFQVSTTADDPGTGSWNEFVDGIAHESNWLSNEGQASDGITYQVPPAIMEDGETYYWRAVARDSCPGQSEGLCPLVDGAGVTRFVPQSEEQELEVSLAHLGEDPRYAMWSHELGNGAHMSVNEANGNLFVSVPFDYRETRLGLVEFGLTYNSRELTDIGIGPGWDAYAGPQGEELPTRVQEMQASSAAGVKLTMHDRAVRYFSPKDAGSDTYFPNGSGTGQILKNDDDSFAYYPSDGGTFAFGSDGYLDTARFAGTTIEAASDPTTPEVLTYDFSSGRLQSVTDPAGRSIDFNWTTGGVPQLDSVDVFAETTFDVAVASGSLAVIDPESNTVDFASSSGLVTEIRDGEIVAGDRTGWVISYDSSRVASVTAPGGGASSSPVPWEFDYTGPFFGETASVTSITDPRATTTTDPNDFIEQVEFSTTGLPIKETGPADQIGYLPITTRIWDSNGSLLCERGPEAHAIDEEADLSHDPSNCDANPGGTSYDDSLLSEEVSYRSTPPYDETAYVGADPDTDGTDERPNSDTTLDEGIQGPTWWTYDNASLSGQPVKSGNWSVKLFRDFGTGYPAGATHGDTFSMRFFGYIKNDSGSNKTYKFKLFSNDGVSLTVNGTTLVNCFGQPLDFDDYNDFNCDTNQVKQITLPDGLWPISIRYSELTGSAKFDFQWNGGSGSTFYTIQDPNVTPTQMLEARAGIETENLSPEASTEQRLDTDYIYGSADEDSGKTRMLPESIDQQEGSESRETDFAYDSFGRTTSETEAPGLTEEAATSYTYATNSWCAEEEEGPVPGTLIERTCNTRGQVTSETVNIRAVSDQPAQERTTTYTYDDMGRLMTENPPGEALVSHTYDSSGRQESATEMIDADPLGDWTATTMNVYDDAGRLTEEIRPEEGGTIFFDYDWADNRTEESDPRDADLITEAEYDGLNREISTTTPMGLVSTTEFSLVEGDVYTNEEIEISPDGVLMTTAYDVRQREVSFQEAEHDPETYSYDEADNQIETTSSSGDATQEAINAFGDTESEAVVITGGPDHVTTYSYDARGNQIEMDGPRPIADADDRLTFEYDDAGNLTAVAQHGLATPNENTYAYSDANELVEINQPMNSTQTMTRTFTYDEAGNKLTATDDRGTTDYDYLAPGWVESEDRPNGITLSYSHDSLGRIWGESFSGSFTGTYRFKEFTLDEAGNILAADRGGSTLDMTYDDDGRLIEVYRTTGGTMPSTTDTMTYSYDEVTGDLDSLTTAAGTTSVTYEDGRLKTVTDPFTSEATTYSYDDAGRVTGRTDPAGLSWARTYEPDTGLVDTQTITSTNPDPDEEIASFDLSYDKAGNVVSREEIVESPAGGNTEGSGVWEYEYDDQNRMVSATDPDDEETSYEYDNTGNRTSVQVGTADPVTTEYDTAGLPTEDSDGTTYTHDEIGNLKAIDKPGGSTGDRCFFFDGFNGLFSVMLNSTTGCTSSGGDRLYRNDAFDRTTMKRLSASPLVRNVYYYEGTGETLAQVDEHATSTTTLGEYANSDMGPLVQKEGSSLHFLLIDPRRDTVGLADMNGDVAGSLLYSPWGEIMSHSGEDSVLGFQSQLTDADTGFVDMTTRQYDARSGRFISRDLLFGDTSRPRSLNQFAYAFNNPISNDDFSGMITGDQCSSWTESGSGKIHYRSCIGGIYHLTAVVASAYYVQGRAVSYFSGSRRDIVKWRQQVSVWDENGRQGKPKSVTFTGDGMPLDGYNDRNSTKKCAGITNDPTYERDFYAKTRIFVTYSSGRVNKEPNAGQLLSPILQGSIFIDADQCAT